MVGKPPLSSSPPSLSLSDGPDIQFLVFMKTVTDLSNHKIYSVFDMLDVDHSGLLDFDEFYLLVCILIAVRVSNHLPPLSLFLITLPHRINNRKSSSTVILGLSLNYSMLTAAIMFQEMSLKILVFSSILRLRQLTRFLENLMCQEIR